MNIFIIGNGFDRMHNLSTAYSDFRQYLITKYPGCDEYDELIPSSVQMPDGDEIYDIFAVAGYISRILDECDGGSWRNLEAYLGNEIFDSLLSDLNYVDLNNSDKEILRACFINRLYPDVRHGTQDLVTADMTMEEAEYFVGRITTFMKYIAARAKKLGKL